MHFQSYKSLSDKTSGVLADLPSTTVSVGPYLGRESFGSVDAGDDSDASECIFYTWAIAVTFFTANVTEGHSRFPRSY